MTAISPLERLWKLADCPPDALERITVTGADPVLPTPFLIGTAAAATIGATALAASELWRLATGRAQEVSVDTRDAAIAFRSERHLRVDGELPPPIWDPTAGFYPTGDGRWIQLHTNFSHHREGVLRVLECENDRQSVADAISSWEGQALEDRLAEEGMCAAMIRSPDEWQQHEQHAAISRLPLLEILRIGDSPPEPVKGGEQPLSGVRVLDLTRIIAGPVAGRALAAHGAEVLLVSGPHLPSVPVLVMDTGFGKRSAHLDLREASDRETLNGLLTSSDVFVQGYRPGALAARGLSPEALAERRPGIVYVTECAYGHTGPWCERRGFDSLVQSASGIAWEGARAAGREAPLHMPAQALDHATGYLAAFGAMVALARRAEHGGSYLVRVSLAQTGHWLTSLGRADGSGLSDPSNSDVADLLEVTDTPFGSLTHVPPVERLSETPPRWQRPSVPLGTDAPAWS